MEKIHQLNLMCENMQCPYCDCTHVMKVLISTFCLNCAGSSYSSGGLIL